MWTPTGKVNRRHFFATQTAASFKRPCAHRVKRNQNSMSQIARLITDMISCVGIKTPGNPYSTQANFKSFRWLSVHPYPSCLPYGLYKLTKLCSYLYLNQLLKKKIIKSVSNKLLNKLTLRVCLLFLYSFVLRRLVQF